MFGSATRLTARICEASVMTSVSAPPPPSACLLSSGLSGLFVPESCDAGWQSSALRFVQPWWKPAGLKETAGSFPLRDLGLCVGHKMLVCHKGSRVVEQHCQYSDLIIKREKIEEADKKEKIEKK